MDRSVKYGAGCAVAVVMGMVVMLVLIVVIIFAAASAPFGWLFGGGEPNHTPSAGQPPSGPPHLWTPTPIPSGCFVTPTPVGVTATPAPTPTPAGGGQTPGTAGPPPTGQVIYLPTPTPCPMEFFPTPNPGYPPMGPQGGGNYDIRAGKITLDKVRQVLGHYPLYPLGGNGLPIPGSSPYADNPLLPYAQSVLDFQDRYGINGGYALAWFVQESSMCTTGISPSAIECGNIIWTPGGNCATHNYVADHDFCGYASWPDAIEAWFRLMSGYYIPNGLTTVRAIVYTYAPCSDNGGCGFVEHYIADVDDLVTEWGCATLTDGGGSGDNNNPHGNPFHSPYWVTQPYGCTDFPEFKDSACAAATGGSQPYFHRGNDLVSKGDPTVFATISGVVTFAGFSGDGFGIRVYVKNGPYLVIYPHLSRTLCAAGQQVNWGDPIGVEGSTGYSTGDHLHYEIHVNGAWVDSTPYLQKP